MFKLGEIVYHNELHFLDKIMDNKRNRPCIVIFNDEINQKVITIPLTTKINSFNKHYNNYVFIPHIIYNYRKLNFVKIDNLLVNEYCNTHSTNMILDKETLLHILKKALTNSQNKKYEMIIEDNIHKIETLIKQEEKEKKHIKKLERTRKRQKAKRNVQ